METDRPPTIDTLVELKARAQSWAADLDQSSVLLSGLFLLVAFAGRHIFARWIARGIETLLARLSISISEDVRRELAAAGSVLVVTFALFVVLDALNPPPLASDTLQRVLASVAVIAVFSVWYNLCGPFVSLLQSDRFGEVQMEVDWMERVARIGVLLFAITSLLKVWQVDISAALTGVGVLGAGLAIATQDLIRNLVAGMNNMSENRFSAGDTIRVDGSLEGTVEKIDLRSTLVRGFDQIPRYVPNSELSNAVVLNFSHRRNRRVLLRVPLVLSSSEQQVLQVRDALRAHMTGSGDFELSGEAPQHVYVEGLTDSAIALIFYAWTTGADYAGYLQACERLSLEILRAVRAAGTELAYPTQSISLVSPDGSAADKPKGPPADIDANLDRDDL